MFIYNRVGDAPIRQLAYKLGPEEMAIVPDWWMTQPEPRPSLHYLYAIVYILFMGLALIGNGLVIWVFSS